MTAPLVLVVLLAVPGQALTPFVAELRRAEARAEHDPERVEFATRAIRAWLPSDGRPLLAHAHFARAQGEAALFDDAAAEEDLTKTLEIDTRNERARLLRARARTALGRGAEAERDALDYLSARPDDGEGWLALAEARLASGSPQADKPARAAFSKAASWLGPEDPRPSLGEGRSRLASRSPQEALASLSAAAARPSKRRAEILSWRSRAYSALGDWSAARADLSRAIPDLERALDERRHSGAVKRGVDAARLQLADAYFRRGLAGEALKATGEALADHRSACDLGLPPACARVKTLEKPEPRKRKNPKGGAGERIYAN